MTEQLKLPVWSFSLLEMFNTCPKKAFHKYVLKEKEPESEAQRQGNLIDKALEARIAKGTPLAPEWARLEPVMQSLVAMKQQDCQVYTQLKIGIKRTFEPSDFFGPEVWGRGVLDFAAIKRRPQQEGILSPCSGLIVDFKNGKNNESKDWYDGGLQRKIFTLLLWKFFPGLDKVTAFNLYLQEAKLGKQLVYTRADEAALWREVLPMVMKVEKAFAEMRWPQTPGPLCSYCPVKTCQFNKS